jgi:hypothetical protein
VPTLLPHGRISPTWPVGRRVRDLAADDLEPVRASSPFAGPFAGRTVSPRRTASRRFNRGAHLSHPLRASRLTVVSGGVGQLSGVALECRDPAALADFYSRLRGGLWSTRTQSGTRWAKARTQASTCRSSDRRAISRRLGRTRRRPCSFTCIFGFTTSTPPSEPCSPWAGRCLTISRATVPESTPIRQVIRSASSRPEIAPSSSSSGRPRHDRRPWQHRRRGFAATCAGYRNSGTPDLTIASTRLAGRSSDRPAGR